MKIVNFVAIDQLNQVRVMISMGKMWKCLICKEEVEEDDPCKCVRNFKLAGKIVMLEDKKLLEELGKR